MIRLALLAGLGFFLWACQTTPSAFISGKADPTFRFRPSQPIYVDLSETATPHDIQFRKLLVSEMNDQGFTLAEELSEDSLILFLLCVVNQPPSWLSPDPHPVRYISFLTSR